MTAYRFLVIGTVGALGCGSDKATSPTCENVSPAIAKTAEKSLRDNALKGATPGATALIREASRELVLMKETHYTHDAVIDEGAGRFDYDCSTFLAHALQTALPLAYREITASNPAPKTRDFVQTFTNLGAMDSQFVRVAHAVDLQPGDILAWLLPPGSEDTGHIVVVAGTPTVSPDRSDELLLPIVDATSRPHGVADTRGPRGGLGLGTVGLLVDATGALVGHRWAGGCGDAKGETTVGVRPR